MPENNTGWGQPQPQGGYQQPQPYQQPQYQQPQQPQYPAPQPQYQQVQQYQAPKPASPLTGGAKAGYLCGGLFLGAIGYIIAYFTTKDSNDAYAREATKWALIGNIVLIVLVILLVIALFALIMGAASSTGSASSLYDSPSYL